MAVSDYLQKSSSTCSYSYSKLKDVLYLVSYEHLKDVQIDNGEAYISGLTELPLRINGFNIQFKEESSLDERYKFQKTLTLSMHGYVNYKIFGGRYYAIIEDVEGTFYMINVDFPSRITHTFNLSKDTNQTDFTFSSLSNFPTLKLNAEFEAVSPVCLGLNVYGIEKLQLIEKEKARLDTVNKTVISTEDFKTIEFLGNSCSFQEVYDGFKVTDTIQFNIALDNYKPSWQYNLLEFLDNRYSAIITPRGNDNKYYPGYNFGLQPSYTIQTASNPSESDIITITLVEMSSQGSTAAVDWKGEQSTETRWRWVKKVGETICYECIGLGRARYLVRQQVDIFGNPTGNYQVMEGYESQYPNFHVVATFTTQEIFETSECSEDETCQIDTTIPTTIYFNAVTCNTYTLQTSCDWEIVDIPSNITVEPMTGHADSSYTVSICNTATPSSTAIENNMKLKCCAKTKVVNIKTQLDSGCIKPQRQYINCMSQDVVFTFDGSCRIEITSIDPKLTYSIGNNTLTVRVPRNYGASTITWSIIAVNCDCSSASTVAYINQDKTYERWVEGDGFICASGNSYHIERRYTGTTQDNITVRTDETRTGSLIEAGDIRCNTSQTKWEWDGESYYCVDGNKFKTVFEYISYDGGVSWIKTNNTRLGDMVEAVSEWCNSAVTYSWVLTSKFECSGTTSYYLYQKYEQRGEQDPIPVYPNYWSVDGDGTQSLSKKMDNDPNCGYVPPVTTIYRWVNLDSSTNYYCDDCPTPQTRTITSGYTCLGYDKHNLNVYQESYDSGETWITVSTSIGDLVEANSSYCAYVPSTSSYKFMAVYDYDATKYFAAPCSAGTANTINGCDLFGEHTIDIYTSCEGMVGSSHPFSSMTSVEFGDCVRHNYFDFGKSDTPEDPGTLVQSKLTAVTLNEGLLTVGSFTNAKITSVRIPSTARNISTSFYDCHLLQSANVPSGITANSAAFYDCYSLTSVSLENGLTKIGGSMFYGCSGLTLVSIPSSVTLIDVQAFSHCTSLANISLGTGLATIGAWAFGLCSSLTNITIPNSVTSIGDGAFYECGLTSINLPDNVAIIGNEAIDYCHSLRTATIGSGVTSMGKYVFYHCENLTGVTIKATTPPTLGYRAFDYTNDCPIYVPAASVDAYKTATNWSSYASRIQAIS